MNRCGLLTAQKNPVPLKSVEVELQVKDHVATVISTLNYQNKEDKPIEALFVFPLPGDAAVCHFSADIGQTHIVAELKEKQQAREEYDDALSSGQQAFLLEESEQSPDIFSLSVGSLPPGESASIRLQYVIELAVEADGALRFCLPAVLNPRYQPQGSEGPGVPVSSVPASEIPYSLSFSARVSSPRPVSKVESSCSLEPLQYLNTDHTEAAVKLAAGHKFDRDVELLIYYKDAHQPSAVVEAGQDSAKPGTLMGDPVVMVSLYPEFPESVMSKRTSCGEFVFLLDRSGSMRCSTSNWNQQETCISSARDTLLLLLKSLPMGCYFNIYGFGSRYDQIFPKSVEYNEKSMEEALKKVKVMQADLGGTEILQPLQHIYSQPCISNQPRQLFVFTDGEVGNTKEVLDLVRKNAGSHRCFSFGIGEGASSALINGLAQEGRGHAQFITGSDRMQAKVMQSLKFALQPVVKDISVTWDLPKRVSATVLSPPITTIFQGQRSLIYAQLCGKSSQTDCSVTVNYTLGDHPYESKQQFNLNPAKDTGLTVHRLAARCLICSLEFKKKENRGKSDKDMKRKVVKLSVQSGVSSHHTAFIAVNKDNGDAVQGPLVRRNVPTPAKGLSLHRPSEAKNGSVYMALRHHRPMVEELYGSQGLCHPCPDVREMLYGSLARNREADPSCSASYTNTPWSRDQPKGFRSFWRSCKLNPVRSKEYIHLRRRSAGLEESQMGTISSSEFYGEMLRAAVPEQPRRDPLLQLVSLQKASGCWLLDAALASVLGKTSEEVEKSKTAEVSSEVWATILALIWLHGFKMEAKDEWELLAVKAASWVQAQNAPCVKDCVAAANALLCCRVKKKALKL
ncbi:von Willebrand factor A domain-containing protein 5A isoform X2 [Oryzias latipes]|uniref:von Willebrand factor A domain-containing protein 5A isoform X2 n=1 Tax=Oryzias latipes TaxID=8090 RepID=UPI000CE271E1|nr:von Willebrand factor A domain-containing protein 5A isoform X2 [Oryzias latipes]